MFLTPLYRKKYKYGSFGNAEKSFPRFKKKKILSWIVRRITSISKYNVTFIWLGLKKEKPVIQFLYFNLKLKNLYLEMKKKCGMQYLLVFFKNIII